MSLCESFLLEDTDSAEDLDIPSLLQMTAGTGDTSKSKLPDFIFCHEVGLRSCGGPKGSNFLK